MNKKSIIAGLTLTALAGCAGAAGKVSTADDSTAKDVFEIYRGEILINEKKTEVQMNYIRVYDTAREECNLWLPTVRVSEDRAYRVMISDFGCDSVADEVIVYGWNGDQKTETTYTREQLEKTTYLAFFDILAERGKEIMRPENELHAKAKQEELELQAKADQSALDEVLKKFLEPDKTKTE